jgi:SAM-dependent methyltransferase
MSNIREKILLLANNKIIQFILYSPFLDYHQSSILSFVKENASKIKPNQKILDAGAGELRYKKYFNHCKYVSNDLCVGDEAWYFKGIDIKSSIYKIPVKNNSFDYILCTQVLEHLEYPELAFKEFYRILKKGGKIILTAPLGQGEHQIPYDYFRYTQYGLKSLGKRNKLKLTYIKPQGGIFINLEYMLWVAIFQILPFQKVTIIRYITFLIFLPIKFLSGIIFVLLDSLDTKKIYTNNYNCIYIKPKN